MTVLAELDHTVINVRFEMDLAADRFRDFGFFLTDRGYHSLGSINHLMMFGSDYIELIGLPESERANPGRAEIVTAPYGINGLVFKTSDVDETFAHLQAIGMADAPPKSFTRPVTTADGVSDASFRTVHVRNGTFPGGRVYFCEHGTPELVWRPEWQSHPNSALAMPEFVIASKSAEAEATDLAKLLKTDLEGGGEAFAIAYEGGHISVLAPSAYQARYGALASPMHDRRSIFGALVMRCRDLKAVSEIANSMTAETTVTTDRVIIRQPDFDSVLEFIG